MIGLIAVFLLWLLGKKRREREAQAGRDNEKSSYGAGAAATEMVTRGLPTSSAAAPRLSLRPVSRMLPEFMGTSKGRLSSGNLLTTIGESGPEPARNLTPSPQPRGPSPAQRSDDRNPNNPFADPQNPFADPEKPVQVQVPAPLSLALVAPKPKLVAPAVAASISAVDPTPATIVSSKPTPVQAPIQTPVQAPIQAPVQTPVQSLVKAPVSTPAPEPIPQQDPAPAPSTPVTPVPVAAVGTGPEPPQGNVYRVLMDFKPSMEDELELQTGQLVRLLHEYDDGWVSDKISVSTD